MILEEALDLIRPLGYPIYPYGTDNIEDCILYNFVPISSDKIKEQNRLEVTVIAANKDMEKGLKILQEVKEALLTLGDNGKTNNILEIALSGGGNMVNLATDTVHIKAIFIIKNKYTGRGF